MTAQARQTRVHQDPFNGDRWQAQYFDPEMQLWFDIGNARDTREAAEQLLAQDADPTRPGGRPRGAVSVCATCGGAISDGALSKVGGWIHLRDADWVDDVHQAKPVITGGGDPLPPYREEYRRPPLAQGARVRNYGEQFYDAVTSGTAAVVYAFVHSGHLEYVVRRDDGTKTAWSDEWTVAIDFEQTGREAYQAGRPRAASLDPAVRRAIDGMAVGTGAAEIMVAFTRGYDKAANEAAAAVLAEDD